MPRETEVITQWKLKKIQGNLGSLSKSKEAEAGLPTPGPLCIALRGLLFSSSPSSRAPPPPSCRRPSPLAFPFPSKQPEIEETSAWDNLLIFFEWPACYLLSCWLREKGKKKKKTSDDNWGWKFPRHSAPRKDYPSVVVVGLLKDWLCRQSY